MQGKKIRKIKNTNKEYHSFACIRKAVNKTLVKGFKMMDEPQLCVQWASPFRLHGALDWDKHHVDYNVKSLCYSIDNRGLDINAVYVHEIGTARHA